MFDRFSNNSKSVLSHARQEAVRLRHDAIAPEHMLLGILAVNASTAASLLESLGVGIDSLREAMLAVISPGEVDSAGQLPLTPEAKTVLEFTLEEAHLLGHSYLGSQHLLLGLLREEHNIAGQVLLRMGVELAALREAVAAIDPTLRRGKLRLLLISNSTMHGGGYLDHCAAEIRDLLGARKNVLFVPYALYDHDGYAAKAKRAFAAMGHDLVSAHRQSKPAEAVAQADAVFVGGGNTFRLLNALYHHGLIAAIQKRAQDGMPYIGSSAGTNVATQSIRTTNDMPIVQPPSFTALQLVPFQINAHYLDPEPGSKHMGETREERIRQFLEEHETPVLGLREGCMLRVEGERMELRGTTQARLFRRNAAAEECTPPCDLSVLLRA